MQPVYCITPPHRYLLPAEGVVSVHLHDDGAGLDPVAGVGNVIGGADAEGVAVSQFAGELEAGCRCAGQQGLPCAAIFADFQVVRGRAGAAPSLPLQPTGRAGELLRAGTVMVALEAKLGEDA